MSQIPAASSSSSNYESIFDNALKVYTKKTKKDLRSHPLLPRFEASNSPANVLQEHISEINQSRTDAQLTNSLKPIVNVLSAFSAKIRDGAGLPYSPAGVIFTGIGVLFSVAQTVSTSDKTLTNVFGRMENSFIRLEAYIKVPPTKEMMDIMVEIMVDVLLVLGVLTKEIKQSRARKFLRKFLKLFGRNDIEDALDQLDRLTQEEVRLADAQIPHVTHEVDHNQVQAEAVNSEVQRVDNRVVHDGVGDNVDGETESGDSAVIDQNNDATVDDLPLRPTIADPPLPSTVDGVLRSTIEDITAECSQFRILVVGKTGCGKSSLINKVFGVEKDFAKVSHDCPGKAKIEFPFCHPNNDKLILHDSEGFESGDDTKFETVKRFIQERGQMTQLKDKLHAIWICISVPVAGDRVVEKGVEQLVDLVRGRVPLIFVFTKYDMLVTSEIWKSGGTGTEQDWLDGGEKAKGAFNELCVDPLTKAIGEVLIRPVSEQLRFSDTIKELIQATDKEIQRQTGVSSHTEPRSFNFSRAQRADNVLKFGASIDVGRQKYWSGLISSTDFTGKQLQQCLDVIHRDIVSVWNIRDDSNYFISNDFRARMLVLVEDLNIPTHGDGLAKATVSALAGAETTSADSTIASGLGGLPLKWIFGVYQNTPENVACVIGYIVDLTVVMHRLSAVEVSKDQVVSVISDYARSSNLSQVHNDVRKFVSENLTLGLRDEDSSLNEIIRLIEKHVDQRMAGLLLA